MSESAQRPWPSSLQLIGSKGLGGAERWFQRFCAALSASEAPVSIGVRAGSGLDRAYSADASGALMCHRLPFRTVWDPISRAAVSRLIRRLQPEIVQTYMGRATRLTGGLATRGGVGARRARPLHVARLGGYYALGPYRHADAWIGNTRQLCDWMIEQGLPPRQVHHIYNFVDPVTARPLHERLQLRDRLGLASDELVLIALGRFVIFKGHAYLLEALSRLPCEIAGRRWRLVLLGDGPLAPQLRRQAQALGLSDSILWLGWRADPARFIQLADLVVFPSLEIETLGNVILEAWANRRPLVTTAFRGAREIARHGQDAWCVPCEDAAALAQGIEQVLRDPELAAAMVRRGYARVEQDFSRAVIMQRYLDLYTELADG
jgi:hypothetical protein